MTQTKDASLLSSHSYTSMVSSCMQHGASFSQLEHSLDVTTDGRGRAGLYYMSYVRYVLLMRQSQEWSIKKFVISVVLDIVGIVTK